MSNENSKRYYWVKLDYKRFESGGDLDFLMGQKNGAEYVVLYMMLCLNTRNTGGELVSRLGEVIVPFDVDKIVRDCKYFDHDTVIVALELYKRLGLVYENDKGNLIISDFQNVVGSESYSAKRMRDMRSRNKLSQDSVGQIPTDVPSASHCDTFCDSDVTKEIRDKSKENKNIEIERDIEESNSLRSLSSSCPEPSAKTPVPDDIVEPNSFLRVRQPAGEASAVDISGVLPACATTVVAYTLSADTAQDNYISFSNPVDIKLSDLTEALIDSGVFTPTTSSAPIAEDRLYVYDNSRVELNQAASKVYFYRSVGNIGWFNGKTLANDDIIKAGSALILRKKATPSPVAFRGKFIPFYKNNTQ